MSEETLQGFIYLCPAPCSAKVLEDTSTSSSIGQLEADDADEALSLTLYLGKPCDQFAESGGLFYRDGTKIEMRMASLSRMVCEKDFLWERDRPGRVRLDHRIPASCNWSLSVLTPRNPANLVSPPGGWPDFAWTMRPDRNPPGRGGLDRLAVR